MGQEFPSSSFCTVYTWFCFLLFIEESLFIYVTYSVANVNQGELWNHIFVLLDRKEKRERSSRGNGC